MRLLLSVLAFSVFASNSQAQDKSILFDGSIDVGSVVHKGKYTYDGIQQVHRLEGSGSNIWGTKDEFQYAYKKLNGNFILQARMGFEGKGVDPHRKIGWMIRTSFDTNAVMASAAVHGDGLTSLQYRSTKNGNVEEKKSSVTAADVVQLERKGDTIIMSVARFGELYTRDSMIISGLPDDVYGGLFICSHNKEVTESAWFDNVRIVKPPRANFVAYREFLGSQIETLDMNSGRRKIIFSDTISLQAPNWTTDGKAFLYNSSKGLMYRLPIDNPVPTVLNTGTVVRNNNDHVISFDGKLLGLSSSSGKPEYGSLVYVVPIEGGEPRLVTETGPSYLHGFSPDGKYMVYTGLRHKEYDLYRIPTAGGKEERLTTAPGLDDGSEYTPDGKYIYFNSVRSGKMQIWRMKADGSAQEQVTNDEFNNWFPHISPDGKSIVFITYLPDIRADDHPFYKQVYLRSIPIEGGKPTVVAYFFGGQGSINTPSWSPDSKKIAFVSNGGL